MEIDFDCEKRLKSYIKKIFENDSSGHDYFHSIRVYKLAMKIVKGENCDKNIVMMSALLHDVDDKKTFSNGGPCQCQKNIAGMCGFANGYTKSGCYY